jgi:hypothetical protein
MKPLQTRWPLLIPIAFLTVLLAGGSLTGMLTVPPRHAAAASLPAQLTDQEFWKLSVDLSEEDGFFASDNLLSNEMTYQHVIPEMLRTVKQGGVYMGVGPEQNFTYIAALRPTMVFIIDIRHGNLDIHLMYKALFELSTDRVEFVSRLFSRKRPEGLTTQSTAIEIFNAYAAAGGSKELFDENLKAIEDHLLKKHGFPLTDGDRVGIRWALSNFYQFGPSINYNSSLSAATPPTVVGATSRGGANFRGGGVSDGNRVSYAGFMTLNDGQGQYRSYLANEENFRYLKDLETRNLIIPVVGNFAGDKAIRAVGRYLKNFDAAVSAFYLSNVEQYLVQDGIWARFCASASTLPLDETSTFIRTGNGPYSSGVTGGVASSSTALMLKDLMLCAPAAR